LTGTQQNDLKRQNLLERLLDAVKQVSHQFLNNLSKGLRVSEFNKLTFWFYVKEHLNHHELQRFYSLRNITSEQGRGRAWLRCALNEHSLERYLHMLLADHARLSAFYEDWAFVLDEERASMLPTMAAGLNSILFAINIDNTDLNGQARGGSSVSHLLKESTQGMSSLWKESTQGVSTLLREIGTATAVVPGFIPRSDAPSDPLPVLPRSTSADSGLRKERRRKKKITNIISFDDDLGVEDEDEAGEDFVRSLRKSTAGHVSSEDALEPPDSTYPIHNGLTEPGIVSWAETPPQNGVLPDTKSIDNEEEEEYDIYGKSRPEPSEEDHGNGEMVVGSLSSVSTWSPRQIITDNDNDNNNSHILIPLASSEPYTQQAGRSIENVEFHGQKESSSPPTDSEKQSQLQQLKMGQMCVCVSYCCYALWHRSLRSLLDGEMEHSAGLRQEVDSLKKRLTELEERHAAKVQALMRENEVLKVQLKKYVGAVQMLKREGSQGNDALTIQRNCDGPPPAPQNRSVADIEELAASYERKLIEVAEMHGELIEFNERLYRSLMAKDNLIGQMRQELIDLRGPVPGDLSQTSDDPSLSDFETESLLRIKSMVYIRILDNEWNVYRRYAEFRALHNYLRPQFPQVDTFNFPPKKAIGNKDAKFVEERRKQLQSYLRMVMNKLIQALPEFTAQPTKETLLQLLPFCQDNPTANESGAKTARSKASSRFPRLGRNSGREARNPEPQSGDL
uniref:Sorting nexin 29 n=1 Tax=Cyprinus carpio TaxID=7962 RepID=A0A8C1TI60_CYPCA